MPEPIFTKLDQFLEKFTKHVSVIKAVKPINIDEQQQIFFSKSYNYNPRFTYPTLKTKLDQVNQSIEQLLPQVPDNPIGHLYQQRLIECQTILKLIQTAGNDPGKFSNLSIQLYGQPQDPYLSYAQKLAPLSLTKTNESTGALLNSQQIAAMFEKAIQQVKLPNTVHIIDEPGRKDKISILKLSGRVKIGSQIARTTESVNGAIAHEIGVHALRSYHGSQHAYRIFQFGTPNYTHTEEGLATIMGYVHKPNQRMIISARTYLLINQALKSDFRTTFQLALKFYPKNKQKAWLYTVRVKRGIGDTAKPGFAFTKDLYFQYALSVSQQLLTQPELLSTAFNGKATLEQLQQYTEPQEHLPLEIDQIKQFLKVNQPTS